MISRKVYRDNEYKDGYLTINVTGGSIDTIGYMFSDEDLGAVFGAMEEEVAPETVQAVVEETSKDITENTDFTFDPWELVGTYEIQAQTSAEAIIDTVYTANRDYLYIKIVGYDENGVERTVDGFFEESPIADYDFYFWDTTEDNLQFWVKVCPDGIEIESDDPSTYTDEATEKAYQFSGKYAKY